MTNRAGFRNGHLVAIVDGRKALPCIHTASDVVLETQVLVSRRPETHFLSLGLGLGLGLELPFKSWSWSRLGPKSWVQDNTRFELLCN